MITQRAHAKKKLNLDFNKYYVLFINPKRLVKNVKLAREVIEKAKETHTNIELLYAENIPNKKMPIFYNASSLLLITSFSEGSPQFIKEAMASNCPIVSVNVGDVKDLIHKDKGSHIALANSIDLAKRLIQMEINGIITDIPEDLSKLTK